MLIKKIKVKVCFITEECDGEYARMKRKTKMKQK